MNGDMSGVNLPNHAEIVVIGGGIIGCSTAYHLARDQKADVLLLEQGKLTSGTTWHAAGLVGQLRSSAGITQLLRYSVDLYQRLGKETGLETGWKMTGCLRLACNDDRWIDFKRLATTAKSFGMEMHLLSPAEVKAMWPLMTVDDLVGASFLPSDGQANPSDITRSLAKGAALAGARLVEGVEVTGFQMDGPRIKAIETTKGTVRCEKIVNCAGQWARQVGAMAGVLVPLQSVKHQYIITEPIEGLARNVPTVRDPDRLTYFKEEVGGLVMGGYETNPILWKTEAIPSDFQFQLFDDDFEHFEQHMTQAIRRMPALETVGVKQMINGPESFTPDGNFILGRPPNCTNMYVGAGFNAFGIASAGGAGWALAEWALKDAAPLDLWTVDIRRFAGIHGDQDWVEERTLEAYGKHYVQAYPHEEYQSARGKIISPLYERLKSRGAVFGSKLGWERPNWFAPKGEPAEDHYAMGRQNWFDAVGREHLRVREQVGVFDQSSFAKFELVGPDSLSVLDWLCANDMRKPKGRLTYTQMLNAKGGIECDLTVARLAEDRFYIVTGTGFRTHDQGWINDNMPAGANATFIDVTEQFGTLALMGPRARDVLQALTPADCSNHGFPFGHVRDITIEDVPSRILRVTYVGELGYELHVPMGGIDAVFDALMTAGADHAIAPVGYRALDSLRLEKGYRAWGSDITPNDTPFEAGFGFAVKKEIDFLGRTALLSKQPPPLKKRFVGFSVEDPDVVLLGRETILRDGAVVGYLTSGGFGYTINKPIGYGYVRHDEGVTDAFLANGCYQLVVASDAQPAKLHTKPLYDPKNARIKA